MPEYSSRAVAPNVFGSVADMEAFLGVSGNNRKRKRVRISVEGYNPSSPEDDIKKELMDLFNSCGEIVGFHFSIDPAVYRRRAFIVLLGDDAEEKALQLDGTDGGGWIVHVRVAPEEDEETEDYARLLYNEAYHDPKCMFGVGVMGYDTSVPAEDVKRALADHFASCGEITHVFVNSNTADSEVHVYFSEENAETRALALYGSVLRGRQLVTRPLVTPRRIRNQHGGYRIGVCIPDHCIAMGHNHHSKVLALKMAKGMI